jgi:tRNA G18 (ribose-2'-O)-methylase SpoU
VADLVEVSDPDDPRLSDYRDLRDVTLRRSLEAERGLFIAEGDKVVRRAVAAGHRPRSFLMARRWLAPLGDLLAAWPSVPCFVVDETLAEEVTGFHVHRGALASMRRAPLPSIAEVLTGRRIVVLEDIVDHTNVGAILRSAAALRFDGCLLAPRCADPLYRRSIKVSMGAVFSLPYTRLTDWTGTVPLLSAAGFTTYALTPAPDAVDLHDVRPAPRLALLVGSEGPGLSQRWLSGADVRVRIPMAAGIDSLNVAAATAVACWALSAD